MASSALPARWLSGAIALVAAVALLYLLRGVLTPAFVAFMLAYMLDPVVDRLEAWGVPRTAGIGAVLGIALLGLLLVPILVLPSIVRDLVALARELPLAVGRVLEHLQPWLASQGIELPSTGSEVLAAVQGDLRRLAPSAVAPFQAVVRTLLGGTASALGALAGLLMLPVLAFYLLQDFDRMVAAARELLPLHSRARVEQMFREVDEVLGQFLRGQLMVMAILAVLYATGYALAGVRLAVPIGIVAGLLSFIPYVGGALALGLALLMVALHYVGIGQVLLVVAVYAIIQFLEGFVITPRIVGDKLGLAPVWVLFALMVGGDVFGFVGIMLALPVAAVIKVFVVHGVASYRQSPLYRGADGDGVSDVAPGGGSPAHAIAAERAAPVPARPTSRLRLRPQRAVAVRRRARNS